MSGKDQHASSSCPLITTWTIITDGPTLSVQQITGTNKSPWKFAHNHPSPSRCDLSSFRLTILKEYICRLESLWRCWSSCSVMFDSCDPMDCGLPGSSVRGISQARILEWVATSFSRGSSCPRDGTQVSCTGRRILHH